MSKLINSSQIAVGSSKDCPLPLSVLLDSLQIDGNCGGDDNGGQNLFRVDHNALHLKLYKVVVDGEEKFSSPTDLEKQYIEDGEIPDWIDESDNETNMEDLETAEAAVSHDSDWMHNYNHNTKKNHGSKSGKEINPTDIYNSRVLTRKQIREKEGK